MTRSSSPERHDVVVVGAGQGGLSAAYYLKRHGLDFVVLDEQDRVGDQWRTRYDSLKLYSPAKYDSLPGLAFPLPGHAFPSGNQMGDYLESYASHFDLPVRAGVKVDRLRREDPGYVVGAGDRTFRADQVIVAAGSFRRPYVPEFADQLSPAIRQLHASDYRRPAQLADGPVLVVGLSHSGADLAMESASAGHRTTVSGKSHGELPFSVDSRGARLAWPLMRFAASNILTLSTPIGRKMAPQVRKGGGPLLRHRRADLERAGVELNDARTVGVQDGRPALADGRVLDVANVIWCTGFRPDFSWIELPAFGDDGFPKQDHGVVNDVPGLYFLGLLFQSGFTSMLVLGAARDAARLVDRVVARARSSADTRPLAAGAVGSGDAR